MARTDLTVDEAAERLGVSPQRVRALISGNRLPAERVGASYLLDAREVASFAERVRLPGRPMSARNVWALLAALSGREQEVIVRPRSSYRIRRLCAGSRERLVAAIENGEPRAKVHRWRVLPSDLHKLLDDRRLVRTGLSADQPTIGIPYDAARDGVDAYVSADDVGVLERRFQPERASRQPNVLLRVPRAAQWILTERRAPTPVVAADLLEHADPRVRREGRRALMASSRDD